MLSTISRSCKLTLRFRVGLVPENGSALNFAQSIGVHRANDFFIFGRKLSAQELESWGLVNKIFPTEGFHDSVIGYLEEHLKDKDGKSMMEAKRLMNAPLRDGRMLAVYTAMDALSQRFADGAPMVGALFSKHKSPFQYIPRVCLGSSQTLCIMSHLQEESYIFPEVVN